MATLLEILLTIFTGVSTLIAVFAFWHTYTISKVRGPEFVIPEVRFIQLGEGFLTVHALIQNIGDRAGHLRFKSIQIQLNDGTLLDAHQPNKIYPLQPDSETLKGFTFRAEEPIDLKGGVFIAKGVYSSPKGKGRMIPIEFEQNITVDEPSHYGHP